MLDAIKSMWVHGDMVLLTYLTGILLTGILLLLVLGMVIWDSIVNRGVNRAMDRLRRDAVASEARTGRIFLGAGRYDRPFTAVRASQALPTIALRREVRS